MVAAGQFTTMRNSDRIIALKRQISLVGIHVLEVNRGKQNVSIKNSIVTSETNLT